MKAAYIKQVDGEIFYGDLPVPKLEPNEVQLKVEACAVNYVDTFVKSGGYQTELTFPFILGRDAVGIVEQVGSNVENFTVGQRVWTNSMGHAGRNGVIAETINVPQTRLFAAPAKVDPIFLAASVHSAATAAIILQQVMELKPQQTLLVEGAAGHVGSKLVELAATMGAHVLTTANPRDFARLKKLGAAACYDYHGDLLQQLPANDFTCDHAIDTSGQVSLQTNLNLLGEKGTVTLITTPPEDHFQFAVRDFYTQSQTIAGFVISQASLTEIQQAGMVLNEQFAAGRLLEEKVSVHSFAETSWAYENIGQVAEKIVLVP